MDEVADFIRVVPAAHTAFGSGIVPSWVPLLSGHTPTLYADFTTENSGPHYWAVNAPRSNMANWLGVLSGSFTRSNSAYYFNSSGTLVKAATNVPRFDYDPIHLTPKGILLEGSGTNSQLNSAVDGNWASGAGYNTGTGGTAPDGIATTSRTIDSGSNTQHLRENGQSISVASGNSYALSVYAKYVAGSEFFVLGDSAGVIGWVICNLNTGALIATSGGGTITSAGNSWYRVTVAAAASATTTTIFSAGFTNSSSVPFPSFTGDGVSAFDAWGAQFEAQPFATSYIPTTNLQANRSGDVFTMPWTWSTSTGTYLAKLTDLEGASNVGIQILSDDVGDYQASLVGVPSNGFGTYNGTTFNEVLFIIGVFGPPYPVVTTGSPSSRIIAAVKGGPTSDDSGPLFGSSAQTTFTIGQPFGWIAKVAVWGGQLATDEQVVALTNL